MRVRYQNIRLEPITYVIYCTDRICIFYTRFYISKEAKPSQGKCNKLIMLYSRVFLENILYIYIQRDQDIEKGEKQGLTKETREQ